MSGIYIHIPFCRQACSYCDFHFTVNPKGTQRFLNALHLEIDKRAANWEPKKISTLYFGGGTPSVLTSNDIQSVINQLQKYFDLSQLEEFTLEMNPEDAEKNYLNELRALGVNRLSLGLQSMNDEELKWMNRIHNASRNREAVKNAQDAGFKNISVDLIFGSRFQNMNTLNETLNEIFDLKIQHLSPYHLTVEENTPLGRFYQRGLEPEPDEDLAAQQYAFIMEKAEERGFIQYEISNFGLEGFFSQHNSSYWKSIPYLGLGPSAHSYDGKMRMYNPSSNSHYAQLLEQGKFESKSEKLSERELINEKILIGLRTIWGLDLQSLQLSEEDFESFKQQLKKFQDSGHLNLQENRVFLTKSGRQIADRLMSDLFF